MMNLPALIRFTEQRLNTMCLNFERVYSNPNEASIHDLRVSIRRLLTHMDYLSFLFDQNQNVVDDYRVYRKKLKRCLKSLNQIRDVQVQIQYLTRIPDRKSGPHKFLEQLKSLETARLNMLSHELDLWPLQKIRKKMRRLIHGCPISDKELELKSHLYLNYLTQELHHAVQECQKPDLPGCHRLRIRLKHYRYHLEMLEQGFGIKQILLGAIRGWQDDLGALQDHRVLLEQVNKMDPEADPVLAEFKTHVQSELDALLDSVREEVHAIRFETQLK